MPFALIHGLSGCGLSEPIYVQGANTQSSFYTDGPSITAAAGFLATLCELDGLALERRGKIRRGLDIQSTNGFSLFIHCYERCAGKVAFNAGTENYAAKQDKLINPPVPLETFTADIQFSLVFEFSGSLPGSQDKLDDLLNARTRRFNGGSITSNIMITQLSEKESAIYLRRYPANQVVDRCDLQLTQWEQMIDYVGFFENPISKKKNLRLHSGIYYLHQTGYQLLEEPCEREGALLNGDTVCEHAYCEPIINLAGLEYSTRTKTFADLHLWQWVEHVQTRSVYLSTQKL